MSEARVRLTLSRFAESDVERRDLVLVDRVELAYQHHRGRRLHVYDIYAAEDVLRSASLGRVVECTETLERKTKGKRYVNARWTGAKTVWRWQNVGASWTSRLAARTRADAIAKVLGWDSGKPTRQSEWIS